MQEPVVQITAETRRLGEKRVGGVAYSQFRFRQPGLRPRRCASVKVRNLALVEVPAAGLSAKILSASQRLGGGFSAAVLGMTRIILLVLFSANLWAQLPEGPGRAETERLCQNCHELARSVSRRQDRDGWEATIDKMVALGTQGTDQELALILDYLSTHFPVEELPPVNVNKAPAIELESRLSLRRSQAAAIIAYRNKNGRFKSIEDLKKVPGVDVEKIEAKKDRITF